MPLKSSGAISLSDIQGEFGGDNPISLSEYYKNGNYVGGSQSTIPSSGAISFSDFHGTQKASSSSEPPTPQQSNLSTIGIYGGVGSTSYEIIGGLYAENTSRTEGRYILGDGSSSDFRNQGNIGGSNKVYTPAAIIQARPGDTIKLIARGKAGGYTEYIEHLVYLGSWSRVAHSGGVYVSGNYDHTYNYTIPSGTSPGNYAIGVAIAYYTLGSSTYRSWKSYSLHIW